MSPTISMAIATASSVSDAEQHRHAFEKLSWDELPFVESGRLDSDAVATFLVKMRACLQPWKQGPTPIPLAEPVVRLEHAFGRAMND